MAFSADDIQFFYSGGVANTNPNLSLGGIKSNTMVLVQTPSAPANVTGLTIVRATNNAQGTGTLSWTSSTNALAWQPPNSLNTYGVVISTDGTYVIGGSDGMLTVTAVFASLPITYKQDTITITNNMGNVFDSVSATESLLGDTEYRCLYVKNANAGVTATDVVVWIKQPTTGTDEIFLGADPAGVGDGVTTGVAVVVANESAAPAGVTFSQPLTYQGGILLGSLLPGQVAAIWEKRVVPPESVGNLTMNTSKITVSVSV